MLDGPIKKQTHPSYLVIPTIVETFVTLNHGHITYSVMLATVERDTIIIYVAITLFLSVHVFIAMQASV